MQNMCSNTVIYIHNLTFLLSYALCISNHPKDIRFKTTFTKLEDQTLILHHLFVVFCHFPVGFFVPANSCIPVECM